MDALARIEAGGIPEEAERRLSAVRKAGGAYTSDLSIADLALCRQVGLRPLSQVMGSSVYQVGFQPSNLQMMAGPGQWGVQLAGGAVVELDVLSEAWNEARERALGRLSQEAKIVGAAAVVGVQLRAQARAYEDSMSSGVIEYSLVGTAVQREGWEGSEPVMTELGMGDFAKLAAAGVEPVGVVGWTSVFYGTYGQINPIFINPGAIDPTRNYELSEFTEAFYAAREQVMLRMGSQAGDLGASGVVGVRLSHGVSSTSVGTSKQTGVIATFHAIGTAIRDEAAGAGAAAPEPIIDLTS